MIAPIMEFWGWIRRLFRRKRKGPEVKEWKPRELPPALVFRDLMRPTKAYADQRQKTRRNRRHKPNRHTRNLYQL